MQSGAQNQFTGTIYSGYEYLIVEDGASVHNAKMLRNRIISKRNNVIHSISSCVGDGLIVVHRLAKKATMMMATSNANSY
jgi:hypothetical protein